MYNSVSLMSSHMDKPHIRVVTKKYPNYMQYWSVMAVIEFDESYLLYKYSDKIKYYR